MRYCSLFIYIFYFRSSLYIKYVCASVYIYICVCVCACMYVYIYIYLSLSLSSCLVYLFRVKHRCVKFLTCGIYVVGLTQGMDGSTPMCRQVVAPLMSLTWSYVFAVILHWIVPIFFPERQAAFGGIGGTWVAQISSLATIRLGMPT